MEAILACHPARSTEWLDCHPKSCERWRIRTGPIDPMHEAWHGNFSRNDRFVPFSDVGNNPICPQNGVLTICGETKFPAMHVYDPFEIPTQRTSLGGAQFLFLSRVTWAAVDCMPCCCMKLSACESMKPGMHSVWTCCHKDRARNRFFFRREVLVFSLRHWLLFKGSVERSLLPWAIFLIFTRNRPWKSEDHLCALFFIEMSKERLEKSERTPPVSWRHWALAYSRDRPYNFSCLSAVSKNGRFRSFFSASGVIWWGKAFRDQQCQFLTRNKSLSSENESNCSMTSECVRTDSILPRGAGLEHRRCKQSIFSLSIFDTLVERLSF